MEQFLELLQIEIEACNNGETVGNPPRKSKQKEPLTLPTLINALEEKFEQKNKSRFSKQKEKFVYVVKRNIIVINVLMLKVLMIVEKF